MALLDFILNLAALLLWLNWRFLRLAKKDPGPGGISLAGTLKSTASPKAEAWPYLAALIGLLLIRALAYYTIGNNLRVNMVLPLGLVSISFNPRMIMRMFLFSGLSFAVFTLVFYFWLLLLSVLNHRVTEPDACLRLVRLHLGRVQLFPVWAKLMLPGLLAGLLWLGIGWWLEVIGLFPVPASLETRVFRCVLMGVYAYQTWIPALLSVMGLYLLNSYIYLGEAAFWNFIGVTARNLLGLLGAWRLQARKLDFTPLLWILGLWWVGWRGALGWFGGGGYWIAQLWNQLR